LINLGFFLRKELAAVLIIPSSWGSQLDGEKLSTPRRISHQEDNSPLMVESGEEERHSEAILKVLSLPILFRRWNNDLYVSLFLRLHPPTCEVMKMIIYIVSFRHI
jgi:hypothetical protein